MLEVWGSPQLVYMSLILTLRTGVAPLFLLCPHFGQVHGSKLHTPATTGDDRKLVTQIWEPWLPVSRACFLGTMCGRLTSQGGQVGQLRQMQLELTADGSIGQQHLSVQRMETHILQVHSLAFKFCISCTRFCALETPLFAVNIHRSLSPPRPTQCKDRTTTGHLIHVELLAPLA